MEWSSLDLWRPRRADANNFWMVAREHNEDQERILMNVLKEGMHGVLVQDHFLIPEGKKRIGTGTELGCWATDGFHNDPTKPKPIMIQGNHGQIDIKNIRIRTVSAIEFE